MEKTYYFYLTVLLLLLWFLLNFFIGSHIPVNQGYGWDGARYAAITLNFPAEIHHKLLSIYRAQRTFPLAIVYGFAQLLHFPLNTHLRVVNAFYGYNLVLIFIGVYFYSKIARHLKWSFPVTVIGFAGLFTNYAVLKMLPYYPILTDYTAFTIGILMLYVYLTNKPYWLLLLSAIGAFVYPGVLIVSGFLYFILPLYENNHRKWKDKFISLKLTLPKNPWIVSLCVTFLTTLGSIYFLTYRHTLPGAPFLQTRHWLMNISTLSAFTLYVFAISFTVAKNHSTWLFKIKLINIVLFAFVYFITSHILLHISNSHLPNALTGQQFLEAVLVEGLAYPFIFLISHFVYYGPIVLLVMIFWTKILHQLQTKYIQLLPLVLFYTCLLVGSESRQYINALPLFVFLACEVLNQQKITLSFAYFILAASIVISKIWLPLNTVAWSTSTDYTHFPAQLYFMSQGPHMGTLMYVVQGSVMVVLLLGLMIYFRKRHTR